MLFPNTDPLLFLNPKESKASYVPSCPFCINSFLRNIPKKWPCEISEPDSNFTVGHTLEPVPKGTNLDNKITFILQDIGVPQNLN